MRFLQFYAIAVLAVGSTIACGDRGDVARPMGVAPAEDRWQLAGEPFLTIGARGGPDGDYLFRPRSPQLLSTGEVALRTGDSEILFFDREGVLVRSIGGEGEGPGEFRGLSWMRVLSDGDILARDRYGTVIRLDSAGTELRRHSLEVRPEINTPIAVSDDGQLYAIEALYTGDRVTPGSRAQIVRDTVRVLRYGPDGSVTAELGQVGSFPWWQLGDSRRGVPLGPRPTVVAGNGLVAYSDGVTYSVTIVGEEGESTKLGLSTLPPAGLPEHLEAWREEREALFHDRGVGFVPLPAGWEPTVPERLPAWNRLLFGDRGCLWALRFQMPGSRIETWDVLDLRGRHLAEISMPAGFVLEQITDDAAVGRVSDDLGVTRIVGYHLGEQASQRDCGSPWGEEDV